MEKICVAVRVRPPVQDQQPSINGGNGNASFFWNVDNNRISLHKSSGTPLSGVSFTFDHVFGQTSPNSRVYDLLTKDIIYAAVEGFNGTVFAYGQTSSGKTFTMNGSENDPGIIHRAIQDVFDTIQKVDEREFLVRVSYMEIYNEEINDLLVVHNQKLPIHESVERGVFVAGLREEIVSNAEQVHKFLEAGEVNRHFGETNMNVRSSRSHTIFRMVIESKSKDDSSSDAIRVSILNLVDLAGSERIAKTGADGVRLNEGKHINKSLMVLGNVINKLSDGAKQRGHIPYRDSKLTRILQSALGGNAKTSIICTVAPEEVHAEETKGTLQFANRAKRVTNCAQVNEILSDAALLKRQTLEIEELRKKLQGSQTELLEQEIMKLRNDLLKFELQHEKLALELEEERKLRRERDLHMTEQQIKIDSLNNMVHFSDSDKKSHTQNQSSLGQGSVESNGHLKQQEEAFSTPCVRAVSSSFVARRSNYSAIWDPDSSPMPAAFNNVADEDEWTKLNKGFIADLDSLHMTPAVKVRSLSSDGITPGFSKSTNEQEVQNLKRQMELVIKERDELEKNHRDQVLLNEQLRKEITELQEEAKLSQEVPHMIFKAVTTCKDIYKDVLSVIQSSVNDEQSFAKVVLSSINEIGCNLFTTLETQCTEALDGDRTVRRDDSLLEEQCKLLFENLSNTVLSSASSEIRSTAVEELKSRQNEGLEFGREWSASWKETMSDELNKIRENYSSIVKEVDPTNQILEDTKARCVQLERQCLHLNEDRESLLDDIERSSRNLSQVSEEKERLLDKYSAEVQKRKDLEEGIKEFSATFASRQKSLVSFHSDLKSRIEGLRNHNHNHVMVPNSLGC